MLLRLAVLAAVACAVHTTHHHTAHEDAKPDCLKAGDGYYVAGCSPKFWRCVNDRLYNYDCPKGLYFNPLKRKCEYKADVPICTPGVQMDAKNVIKASAEFNCTALADGPYKPRDIACSNTFITCFSGMAVEQACPFGQFFHEQNKQCDYKDNVPGCLQSGSRGSKIGGSIGATCTPLRSGHVDVPCDADEVCQKIDAPEDGRYLCPAPFAVWYGPLGTDTSDQWTIATEGLRCGEDGRWYNGNLVVSTPAVDCTAKRSALGGQPRSMDAYGSAPAPPQRSPAVSANAKAAALNACPGMFTGKESEGIPCEADEVCQGIQRPKNGRYSCEAPFAVWYGPVRGSNAQWKQAKDGLVCGTDGFWYDNGAKVDASGIDCTAKKTAFQRKEMDAETSGCPSLSTNDREIPCKGDEEVCQPILKAVDGKYACPTPYRVWYGPRGGAESAWKQAKDALICKSGAWFDGELKIDATAVDCTVKKIDCSKLGDGTYNGEPGRCSTHFWQCSNEQAYLYPCAPGLFFDDFSKQCDYKEVVESCGGVRRSPDAATTTTTEAPLAPVPAADATKKTDCPTLITDSKLPCRSNEACVAPADPVNQKYLCEAPYSLWYGPLDSANQWKHASKGIQCRSGQWFSLETPIAPEAVHCTTHKFECFGKTDGSYAAHSEKCTSYFWNCAHGDAFLYRCPAGLFFDVDTLSCDYKEVNVACGGVKKDKTGAPTELVPASDAIKPAFDCSSRDNGYHEDGGKCKKKFWNCADGKSFQIDCPEGLVYDGRVQLCQYPAACDADLPVTTTPAVPPSNLDHGDISQKPALPTTSFDCSTQPDGLYAEKKCHKQYVQCTNGRTFAKECPAGLVYTAFKQSCDYKQICMNPPAATTAAPSTTSAPAADAATAAYATYERTPVTTTTTTQAPVAPATFDSPNCANLEDGAHAMARCGQEFFLCWQSKAEFSKCTDGLIFNALNAQCDYRSNVNECNDKAADATITAAPVAGQAAPPSPPTTTPTPDLFCEGRGDGHFGSGCQSFFYSCQGGVTTKMFCPMGLHYDAESKTCDLREVIVACGGKKEQSTTTSTPSAAYVPFKPTAAPSNDVPMPPVDNFCAGKANGFYTEDCQKYFYSCQEGITYKMTCPTDLYYDSVEKACNHREAIRACGATPAPTTQAPTTPAAAPTSSYLPIQPVAPVKDIPVTVIDFCVGKADAFYGNGCQPLFYSCQAGVTYKMDCPAGLYYDADQKKCDRREEIVACGATPTTTQAPVTKAADVPVVPIDNYCNGKKDGFYALDCSAFFYSCQNGATYKMTCPSGLYYDLSRKSCENKEEIVACGATPATAQTPAAAPASTTAAPAPYKAADVPVVAPAVPVAVAENICAGKTNVIIGAGCQNTFYNCHDGVSYKTTCSAGLFFDVDTLQCNYKEVIVACGGKKQEATVAPVVPALDRPVVAVENFCLAKEDGFYGVGCETFFYTCQGGVSYKMNCPSGLYYEQVSKLCDRKEEIAACGAAPTATSTPSIALAPTPSAYSTVTTQSPLAPSRDQQQPIPLITNENFCTGKMDGFYGDTGCVGHFLSCSNGLTAKMLCPSGLFYDISSKQCDNKEDIVACGGVARPTPAVVPAAAPTVPPAAPYAQPAVQQPLPPTTTTAAPVRDVVPVVSQEKFCVGKPDGTHTNGCDSFYYSCVNQMTYKMACPSGLFYEITTSVCDVRENVVACGGQKPVVNPVAPLAHTQPVPTVDQFCFGKVDGFYGVGCAAHFYSCNQAYTYKMICPSGLFYDITVKACNNREKVAACGAVTVPVAPVLPVSPVTPAAAPQSQYSAPVLPSVPAAAAPVQPTPQNAYNANFCANQANGIYTVGCASWYYSCANGYTNKMICGANNLFFDSVTKRCDMKENVVACGGQAPLPQILPAPTTAPVRDTVTPINNFCSGKADGNYPEGCSGFYYNCQSGYTYKMACPAGLFYDAPTKRCEMKDVVVACGAQQPQPLPVLPQQQKPQQPQTQYQPAPTTIAPVRDAVAPVNNFCSGKVDGIYTEGCSDFFYNCINGHTVKMACPAGLFYNAPTSSCEVKETIIACGGKPQTVQPQTQPATTAPVRDVVAPVNNFCSGKVDGIYTEGCSGFYYNCQNGYTYKMACPVGLFYNAPTKRCEMKETVVACGAQQQPQLAQPQTQYQPAPTTIAPVRDSVAPVNNFCSGKVDGIYTEGCSGFYYNCQNGYTHKMACPAGLFYNAPTKRCEMKETVVTCGAQQQPQLAQPQTQYQPAPTAIAPVRDVVAPVSNFCSGKKDGHYTEGCSSFYYTCQNGNTHKMACPTGLFYDAATTRCETKDFVIACGAQTQQQQPQPQTPYQRPAAPVAPVVPVRDIPAVPVHSFCTGKADGQYADGCKNFFYYCSNGATFKMDCSAGLFYDVSGKQCERLEKVVACGGTAPAAAPARPAPPGYNAPEAAAAPAASYSRPAAPVKDTGVTDKTCAGKQDSFFGEGCNSFYHACISGATYKMACPTGLFFDTELQSCEYRDNIPNCGGKRVEVAPTPSPALDNLPPAPVNSAQCNGKADGIYAAADCSEEYFTCQAGLLRKEACQTGLFYNEANGMCDWRTKIAKCGARDTLPTRAPETADYGRTTSRPIKYDSHKEEQQKTRKPALSPSGASCAGQADGYYASGCSADYTACVNGQSMAMHCPSDLRYSASTLMCDYSDNVPECGGSTPSVAKDVVPRPTLAPVVPVTPKLTIPTQPPVKEVHPRCANRIDGIYALAPCSQNYLACVDEKANIGRCRDDLYYSTVSGMCDWQDKVTECSRLVVRPTPLTTRSVPTVTPVPVAPASDTVRPIGNRLNRPTVPLGYLPDCSQIADGVYAINNCSPYYSRCAEGRLSAHGTCPAGTFFSATAAGCLDKSNFPQCAAPVPTSAPTQAPALAPAAQPNYGVQPAQQQPQQPGYQQQQTGYQQQQYAPSYSATYGSDIYADPSQFCYGRPDAIYGNTCQKNYMICTRGATLAYACPRDFVFDRDRAVCDHPSRIAQCGTAPSYGYTVQSAPAYQQQQSYGYTVAAAAAPQYQQQSYANY